MRISDWSSDVCSSDLLTVAIVGDVLHSRVARSDIHGLRTLGTREIRVVAPPTLIPAGIREMGVKVFHDLDEGLAGVDVVMLLRLQKERMLGAFLPSLAEFHRAFGLTKARPATLKPDEIGRETCGEREGVSV